LFNPRQIIQANAGFLGSGDDFQAAQAVLLGVPMDWTTSFRPGTRLAPHRIREASYGLEEYSFHLKRDLSEVSFFDQGDLILPYGNVHLALEIIEQGVSEILEAGKVPFVMGGEHLITWPIMRALHRHFPELVVLHFDAHADLRDEYLGERESHATVMRRVLELVGPGNVYQFGIRSGTAEEWELASSSLHFYPETVLEPLRQVLPELQGKRVYVTLDIDVVDPAFAPGTGTPEPGGISSREIISVIGMLGTLDVVGFDLVEVSPPYDPTDRTAILAAKILREALLSFVGPRP